MFVRHKRSGGMGGAYEYLQIVRSYREGGKVGSRSSALWDGETIWWPSSELDGLLKSLAKFSEKLRVVEAVGRRA